MRPSDRRLLILTSVTVIIILVLSLSFASLMFPIVKKHSFKSSNESIFRYNASRILDLTCQDEQSYDHNMRQDSKNRHLDYHLDEISVEDDFKEIKKKYGIVTQYKNVTVPVETNLSVEKDQVMIIYNSTLIFNNTIGINQGMRVKSGGALYLIESYVRPADNESNYYFQVNKDSLLYIRNSTITGCGYPSGDLRTGGLWVNTDGSMIIDSVIAGNTIGMIYDNSIDNIMLGNRIYDNDLGIFVNSSNNNYIVNNTIFFNNEGILLNCSQNIVIINNTVCDNSHYGILISGHSNNNVITNNTAGQNKEGLSIQYSNNNILMGNDINYNRYDGLFIDSSDNNLLLNNTMKYNKYGIRSNSSDNNVMVSNIASNNGADGLCFITSNNNLIIKNNASYNTLYGYHIEEGCDGLVVSKSSNVAIGNGIADYEIPAESLNLIEISFVSIFFALIDKVVYMIDFQKVIISNIFSGMVSPIRDPISKKIGLLVNRVRAMLGISPRNYKKSHINTRFDTVLIHLLEGKDTLSIVRVKTPKIILSNEIALHQIRFIDLLLKDRMFLFRHLVYFSIMTGIGILVYYTQVSIGTTRYYFMIPLTIQFIIMFFIGMIIEQNIIGRIERIRYDLGHDMDIVPIRDDLTARIRNTPGFTGKSMWKRKKLEKHLRIMRDQIETLDYLECRKHYMLFTDKGYMKAIESFRNILEKNPEDHLALAGLSEAHTMLGKWKEVNGSSPDSLYREAMDLAIKAYSINGRSSEVLRALAFSHYFSGKPDAAESDIKLCLSINPRDAEAVILQAIMADSNDKKIKLLQKACSMNPYLMLAMRESGITYYKMGLQEKAYEMFTRALKINPGDPYAHYYLGLIHESRGDIRAAIDEFNLALDSAPDFKNAHEKILLLKPQSTMYDMTTFKA